MKPAPCGPFALPCSAEIDAFLSGTAAVLCDSLACSYCAGLRLVDLTRALSDRIRLGAAAPAVLSFLAFPTDAHPAEVWEQFGPKFEAAAGAIRTRYVKIELLWVLEQSREGIANGHLLFVDKVPRLGTVRTLLAEHGLGGSGVTFNMDKEVRHPLSMATYFLKVGLSSLRLSDSLDVIATQRYALAMNGAEFANWTAGFFPHSPRTAQAVLDSLARREILDMTNWRSVVARVREYHQYMEKLPGSLIESLRQAFELEGPASDSGPELVLDEAELERSYRDVGDALDGLL